MFGFVPAATWPVGLTFVTSAPYAVPASATLSTAGMIQNFRRTASSLVVTVIRHPIMGSADETAAIVPYEECKDYESSRPSDGALGARELIEQLDLALAVPL